MLSNIGRCQCKTHHYFMCCYENSENYTITHHHSETDSGSEISNIQIGKKCILEMMTNSIEGGL